VTELSARNFGLAIAYFIPGFVALWGLAEGCDTVRLWLIGGGATGPTLGGFALVVVASLTLGMTASAIRWASIDQLHHRTGLKPPRLDFAKLPQRLDAFYALVENHYRYYQFYANMAVATAFALCMTIVGGERLSAWAYAAVVGVEAVFLAGSRDALRKYYERSSLLLGERESEVVHDERISPGRVDGTGEEAGEEGNTAKEAAGNRKESGPESTEAEGVTPGKSETAKKKPVG
jgi:hypothetical protein